MNAQTAPLSKNVERASQTVRDLELDPTLRRDLLLQRVRAARKRLAPMSSNPFSRLR